MKTGNVLVVDDDPDIRETTRLVLEYTGYRVSTAANGAEALERLRGGAAHCVILLDLMMPVMDGWAVARTLREEASSCPAIIAVTANSLGVDAGRQVVGERPLFDEVLVKPVSPGELVRTVRAYVAPDEAAAS